MPDIHFAALYGVDYDPDLMEFWARHYAGMRLDTYTVFLNTQETGAAASDRLLAAHDYFKGVGFQVFFVSGAFDNGQLRARTLGDFAKKLDPDDFLVTADSDEFHDLDASFYPKQDVLYGVMIDRYDDTLHDAVPGRPLKDQFPREGDMEKSILDFLPESARRGWPRMNKNKVLCARAGFPVAYAGSHALFPDATPRRPFTVKYGAPVLHYTWRNSILRRMAGRTYFEAPCVWYVWKFFGGVEGKEPPELLDSIRNFEETQIRKGWELCPA